MKDDLYFASDATITVVTPPKPPLKRLYDLRDELCRRQDRIDKAIAFLESHPGAPEALEAVTTGL